MQNVQAHDNIELWRSHLLLQPYPFVMFSLFAVNITNRIAIASRIIGNYNQFSFIIIMELITRNALCALVRTKCATIAFAHTSIPSIHPRADSNLSIPLSRARAQYPILREQTEYDARTCPQSTRHGGRQYALMDHVAFQVRKFRKCV